MKIEFCKKLYYQLMKLNKFLMPMEEKTKSHQTCLQSTKYIKEIGFQKQI
jgi:hypothetical protein